MPAHSKFSQELFDAICERMAQGEPLAVICRDPAIPITKRTFDLWCAARKELAEAKGDARDDGADSIAQRARLTARGKGPNDGGESTGDVQRDKLIIDTDLKLLAKWDKRYADKTMHGNDPENPLPAPQFIINPVQPAPPKDE
jgi:hypothetical protein